MLASALEAKNVVVMKRDPSCPPAARRLQRRPRSISRVRAVTHAHQQRCNCWVDSREVCVQRHGGRLGAGKGGP